MQITTYLLLYICLSYHILSAEHAVHSYEMPSLKVPAEKPAVRQADKPSRQFFCLYVAAKSTGVAK